MSFDFSLHSPFRYVSLCGMKVCAVLKRGFVIMALEQLRRKISLYEMVMVLPCLFYFAVRSRLRYLSLSYCYRLD
jgi:hypothetical protein